MPLFNFFPFLSHISPDLGQVCVCLVTHKIYPHVSKISKIHELSWLPVYIIIKDVRVQILIWFQTFLLFTKPHFHTFNAVWMHWKAHLFRHFWLFQIFSQVLSHTCINNVLIPNFPSIPLAPSPNFLLGEGAGLLLKKKFVSFLMWMTN